MFYFVTRRFNEDSSDGSQIIGMYTSLKEAEAIFNLYTAHSHNETVEIIHFEKNLTKEDMESINITIDRIIEDGGEEDEADMLNSANHIIDNNFGSYEIKNVNTH